MKAALSKTTLTAIIAVALAFTLNACGNSNEEEIDNPLKQTWYHCTYTIYQLGTNIPTGEGCNEQKVLGDNEPSFTLCLAPGGMGGGDTPKQGRCP
ncbi:MAG: hypothetical protein LBB56_02435, partial [Chitinispirillales bacterium]|nr:hypothetical protein [Chitinispirillales bacterium]